MDSLIDDLLLNIFEQLNYLTLALSRRVCRRWQRLINGKYNSSSSIKLVKAKPLLFIGIKSGDLNSEIKISRRCQRQEWLIFLEQMINIFDERLSICFHPQNCTKICQSKGYILQFNIAVDYKNQNEYILIDRNHFFYQDNVLNDGNIKLQIKGHQIAILKFLKTLYQHYFEASQRAPNRMVEV